jgi:hypothetical protein
LGPEALRREPNSHRIFLFATESSNYLISKAHDWRIEAVAEGMCTEKVMDS